MKSLMDSQELARRFNEDEAVWRRYQQKRGLRQLFGLRSLLPQEVLDGCDWLEAERECREKRYVGRPF